MLVSIVYAHYCPNIVLLGRSGGGSCLQADDAYLTAMSVTDLDALLWLRHYPRLIIAQVFKIITIKAACF